MNSDTIESRLVDAESRARNAETRAADAERMLQLIYQSHSWRFTAPLRWMTAQVRLLRSHGLLSRLAAFIKSVGRFFFGRVRAFLAVRPGLRNRCVWVLQKTGLGEKYLKLKYAGLVDPAALYPDHKAPVPAALCHLSPYTRLIYAELKDAVENSGEPR